MAYNFHISALIIYCEDESISLFFYQNGNEKCLLSRDVTSYTLNSTPLITFLCPLDNVYKFVLNVEIWRGTVHGLQDRNGEGLRACYCCSALITVTIVSAPSGAAGSRQVNVLAA
jgi:hypothetical protein